MKKWIKNQIRQFIVWYVLNVEHGNFNTRRRGGADQVCRIFSKRAYDEVVKRALDLKGFFYSHEQLQLQVNKAVENTIKALRNCGEDSDCDGCYLQVGEEDCVMNHVKKSITPIEIYSILEENEQLCNYCTLNSECPHGIVCYGGEPIEPACVTGEPPKTSGGIIDYESYCENNNLELEE